MNEIIGNSDIFWSTYLYKNRNNDTIYTGPVWDFDTAANNDNRVGDAVNKLMLDAAHSPKQWINRLMEDKIFRNKIRDRWNLVKTFRQILLTYLLIQWRTGYLLRRKKILRNGPY